MNPTAATATLPWHYLSSLACLTKGQTVTTRPEPNETTRNLHAALQALADDEALLKALEATQTGNSPGDLFSFVRVIGLVASKDYYAWSADWPDSLSIKLRTGITDLILSPTALLVPWPFPDPSGTMLASKHEAARVRQNKPPIPAASPAEKNPTDGLALGAFMRAVDDAIDPCSDWRDRFAEVRNNDKGAKDWLVNQAATHSTNEVVYPESLNVHVDDGDGSNQTTGKTTPQTAWEVRDGHLHLEMGWWPHPDRKPCLKTMNVDKWLCGASKGF